MTTTTAAYDALQAFVVLADADQKIIDPAHVTFTRVIRAWQNAKRPDGAYAMIQLLAERDLNEAECFSYAEIAYPGTGLPRFVQTQTRVKAFLFDIEIFATDAVDRARDLINALETPAAAVTLAPWIAAEVKGIRHAPELVQQRWEGRAIVGIELRGMVDSSAVVDTIDQVPVTSEGYVSTTLINSAAFTRSRS